MRPFENVDPCAAVFVPSVRCDCPKGNAVGSGDASIDTIAAATPSGRRPQSALSLTGAQRIDDLARNRRTRGSRAQPSPDDSPL